MKYTYNNLLIARNIKLLRKNRNESVLSISNYLGISEADYLQIELGYSVILVEHLMKISCYYNIKIDSLIKSEDILH